MNNEDIYITKLEQAPSELVLAINSVDIEQKVMSIAGSAGLTPEETEVLAHIIDMYIYGALQFSELPQTLTNQLPKIQSVISNTIDAINNTIYIPIQTELKKQNEIEEPLEQTLSAEELYLESDKPEFWVNEPDEEIYTEEDVENLIEEGVDVSDLEEITEETEDAEKISDTEHQTLQKAGIVVEGAPMNENNISVEFIKQNFEQPATMMHTDSNHVIPNITKSEPVASIKSVPKPPKKDLYLEPIV